MLNTTDQPLLCHCMINTVFHQYLSKTHNAINLKWHILVSLHHSIHNAPGITQIYILLLRKSYFSGVPLAGE